MVILGINYYFHDSTACIIKDGKLLAAIEEERLNRDKHTRLFPTMAIARCLKIAELDYNDIDHIAISIKPNYNWTKKLRYGLSRPRIFKTFAEKELFHAYSKQKDFWIWHGYHWKSKKSGPEIHFIEHHFSHAPGTFFISPYKEAALLGIDGSGEWATTYLGYGKGNKVSKLGESLFPHSFGSFYESITQYCGFRTNYDEGKTMGLAPMGNPDTYYDKISKLITIDKNGNAKLDLSYFNFQNIHWNRFSDKFYKEFGMGRKHGEEFLDKHKDMAAAFQKVLEDKVLEICDILHKKTKADYLVISGGVSLNSVMNGRIVRESPFNDVYVMPAAGDNGTAIGAAFYLYNGLLKQERVYIHNNPYLGTQYSNEEIKKLLDGSKLNYESHDDICDVASELLVNGKIIGWFQGIMEIGPRALGSRSILANPAYPDMKDKINAEVKFREAYRPFAPSATIEGYKEFFDLEVEAPFMLKVCEVRKEKQEVIPSITHVDGSARLQTVRKELHPRYHRLIESLGEKTGIPVVLNTSFNVQGQPIVESPKDAIQCFYSTGLDALVIGNYLLKK